MGENSEELRGQCQVLGTENTWIDEIGDGM